VPSTRLEAIGKMLPYIEYELAAYGDWVYIPPHGYVWVPGGVDPYWRPYYNGRWIWHPLSGWTWLPYEPWGWVAFHYGRWHWGVGLGWYWIPTTVWGPAWVSWYWGYDYFGWVPLSYYGYPAVIIDNVFYGRYRGHYYPNNSRVLTVIHKNQLKARNVSKVALSQESIKNLGNIKLSKESISIKPLTRKISVDELGENRLFLKNKGSLSEFKQGKRLSQTVSSKFRSSDVRTIKRESARSFKSSQERKTIKRKIGYPSSSEISSREYSKTRKSGSILGRIYRYITGDSKSIKSRSSGSSSSQGKTPEKSISRSSSKRSSSSTTRKSSSSSRSSSKSAKVKKKK